MEIKRRTEILIETSRQIVVSAPGSSEHFTCPHCGNTMLAADRASAILHGVKEQLIDGEKT